MALTSILRRAATPIASERVSRLARMLAPYRKVMATPGAKAFSGTGLLARMPISMVTLGIVLLVVGKTGSYGLAGTISAAYMATTAASSPLLARLIDNWGQARVLVPGFIGFTVGMLMLVVAVESDWATPIPHLLAALSGLFYPPIGACVRARWTHALGAGRSLHTAFSFEAVVDEAIFMLGPVIVTVLATSVHEMAGIAAVTGFALVGGLAFASLRATQPPVDETRRDRGADPPLGWALLLPLVFAAVCLGSLFGATEVVTVAFAEEQGSPGATGPLLAGWAAGSLIAGLITGAVNLKSSASKRYRLGAVGMGCAMVPLPFVDGLAVLAVALFVAGFAISPTMVASVSLVESNVPASRLTEGITWLLTGLGLGIAPGAAIAGRLIDEFGASPAYYVPVVSGVLAAVIAVLTPARTSEHTPALSPN